MGRHRHPDAGRSATRRAARAGGAAGTGGTPGRPERPPVPDPYAAVDARAERYLYATDDDYARATGTVPLPPGLEGTAPAPAPDPRRGRRRRGRTGVPVRAGLLGVTAALALGTVAVAAGVVPGLHEYRLGGGSTSGADRTPAAGAPSNGASEQGGTWGGALPGTRPAAPGPVPGPVPGPSRGTDGTPPPSPSAAAPSSPATPAAPSSAPAPATAPASPSVSAPDTAAAPSRETPPQRAAAPPATAPPSIPTPAGTTLVPRPSAPPRAAAPAPRPTGAPVTVSAEAAAEAEVVRLVNLERAKAGCGAVAANSALTSLAETYSTAMADQGFFAHTDPGGATPWDRAAKAGITGLGAENIARGQSGPAAVMSAWMSSPEHRANILNCRFTTLGVGAHFGAGGPWWTQDFGY
ncbi:CAP domain-containing protein [Streptomyces andamanensis]|uniref:CAP domain-containing protein n=1 Tax=Streptomyces andamanensis TaxID=1565035 RepID=A0ABV8TI57_9ACTN